MKKYSEYFLWMRKMQTRKEYVEMLEDIHENFLSYLVFGPRDSAVELVPFIKPDYKKSRFLCIAVRENDLEILGLLLKQNPKKGIKHALTMAALHQNEEAAKMLLRYKKINIESFQCTTDYSWLKKVEESL